VWCGVRWVVGWCVERYALDYEVVCREVCVGL
jgi:hypothetical protein